MEAKEIWESFNDELRGYVRRRVLDDATADDVVQEIFEKVIKNIGRIQEVENVQEYLYGIARNTLVDSFRSRKLKLQEIDTAEIEEQTEDTIQTAPSKSLNVIVSNCCIRPFINRLPEKYRQALLAVDINGLSQKELAAQLDISYSGAKSRVQRGREQLRVMFQDCCQFEYDAYGNLIQNNNNNCGC